MEIIIYADILFEINYLMDLFILFLTLQLSFGGDFSYLWSNDVSAGA